MIVIVNSIATRTSGTLSIYRQFISHLKLNVRGNKYYIFIDSTMDQPKIEGVSYIHDNNHSWRHRIAWESYGLDKWMKKSKIEPDVIVSLQNTGCVTSCRQVIYYHMPLPFFPQKWNVLKKRELIMWLYKHFYLYFVKRTLNDKTDVVVQIPFIKKKFVEYLKVNPHHVHILFPDVENVGAESVNPLDMIKGLYHFVFPATPVPYKGHKTLVEAVRVLKGRGSSVWDRIRIHFTINNDSYPTLINLITKYGLCEQFAMNGVMPHAQLLSLYKSVQCLLFPSTIETLGLPLLEAAAFGLPIVVSDLDYAHEVLGVYEGSKFVNPYDYNEWADEIEKICLNPSIYSPLLKSESNWNTFFDLVDGNKCLSTTED